MHDFNPVFAQMRPAPDTGPHQKRRRMERPGGKNDFPRGDGLNFPAPAQHRAGRAFAVEDDIFHPGFGADMQIFTRPDLSVQIAHGRGMPPVIRMVGDRDREPAIAEIAVLILYLLITLIFERPGDGKGKLGPFVLLDPANDDGPVLAVEFAAEIDIGLQLLEIGQHAVPVPAFRAKLRPFGIVFGAAAIGHLRIDAGAAADQPRLFHEARRGAARRVTAKRGVPDLQFVPVILGIERRPHRIRRQDIARLLARLVILARLHQKHGLFAQLGKAAGHRATRGPATQNHIIIYHDVIFPDRRLGENPIFFRVLGPGSFRPGGNEYPRGDQATRDNRRDNPSLADIYDEAETDRHHRNRQDFRAPCDRPMIPPVAQGRPETRMVIEPVMKALRRPREGPGRDQQERHGRQSRHHDPHRRQRDHQPAEQQKRRTNKALRHGAQPARIRVFIRIKHRSCYTVIRTTS